MVFDEAESTSPFCFGIDQVDESNVELAFRLCLVSVENGDSVPISEVWKITVPTVPVCTFVCTYSNVSDNVLYKGQNKLSCGGNLLQLM